MKTIVTIGANVDRLQFGYYDVEAEEFVPIDGMSAKEVQVAAEKLGCSELLLDALMMFAESVSDLVGGDLEDIWKRLDGAEK